MAAAAGKNTDGEAITALLRMDTQRTEFGEAIRLTRLAPSKVDSSSCLGHGNAHQGDPLLRPMICACDGPTPD
jgi:hypothetical protein